MGLTIYILGVECSINPSSLLVGITFKVNYFFMNIPERFIKEIITKAHSKYDNPGERYISIQYSLAIQILIESLGLEILDILTDFFPEAKSGKVRLKEHSRSLEEDGFIKVTHTYLGDAIAACVARVIFFAHCILDLEYGVVYNFERVKRFCKKPKIADRSFERTYYEIIVASRMARRNLIVEFIEEGGTKNENGKKIKTPDLLIKDGTKEISIECKCNVFQDLDYIDDQLILLR